MKLKTGHIEKTDPLLQDALRQAEGAENLRAVMLLGPEGGYRKKGLVDQEPDPSQFPSRTAYRRALIEQREGQLADDIGPTLEALEKLSLAPRGGKISRVVVVEGQAHQILTALDLPGVRHASLDRPIDLIEPGRPAQEGPEGDCSRTPERDAELRPETSACEFAAPGGDLEEEVHTQPQESEVNGDSGER